MVACAASKRAEITPRRLHTTTFAEPMFDTLAFIRREGELISPASREFARLAYKSLTDEPSRVGSLTVLLSDHSAVDTFLG